MSTTIKIKCIDQTLTYEGTPTVASGGVNEDYVEFEFCPLWDGFSKVAVFYQNKGEIYYSIVSSSNIAVIPKEVIATKGTMYLGVMGVKDNVTKTSLVLPYRIESGALDGFKPEEPTQDLYQQVLELSQEIVAKGEQLIKAQSDYEKAMNKAQEDYETAMNTAWADYKKEVTQTTQTVARETVSQELSNYALKTSIPIKVSQLTNDSKYITASALTPYAKSADIPINVSQLTNDSGYQTSTNVTNIINSKFLYFKNITVATEAWETLETAVVEGYDYKANIPLTGVTADFIVELFPNQVTNDYGMLSMESDSYEGGVSIYANAIPDGVCTFNIIKAEKGQ